MSDLNNIEFDVDQLSNSTLSDIREILSDSDESDQILASDNSLPETSSSSSSSIGEVGSLDDRNRLDDFQPDVPTSIASEVDESRPDSPSPELELGYRPFGGYRWHSRKIEDEANVAKPDVFVSNFHLSPRMFEHFVADFGEFFPPGRCRNVLVLIVKLSIDYFLK